MEQQTNLVEQTSDLIKQSDSTILIAIGILVLLAILAIPLIRTLSEIRSKTRKEAQAGVELLVKVVQENTAVNASLKTLIEKDQKFCKDCRNEQLSMFRQLQDNQDLANMKLVEIHTILKKEDK